MTRRRLPDFLKPGLKVVFVGFNPGMISARMGHYYANPRNAFWRLLSESKLIPVRLGPEDDHRMPQFGLGLTDLVKRPTRSANDLRSRDIRAGRRRLEPLLRSVAPGVIAFNGKGVYGKLSGHREFAHGWQSTRHGRSRIFVLPSTSPANARLSHEQKLGYFCELARWVERQGEAPRGRQAGGHPGRLRSRARTGEGEVRRPSGQI